MNSQSLPPLLANPLDHKPFPLRSLSTFHADIVIVGTGIAGLSAAISAANKGLHVMLLSKGDISDTNTQWAQGGIAAAVGADDSPELHASDTIRLGYGLSEHGIVEAFTGAGPEAIHWLNEMGMPFDLSPNGELHLEREGGHRVSRILHSAGTATGRELQRTLVSQVRSHALIDVYHSTRAIELLKDGNGKVSGIVAMTKSSGHKSFETVIFEGNAIVLATGGGGQIYRETTNPQQATADGLGMALRIGAELNDLEFVQFHPTILYLAGAARFLISEVTRGAGAKLVDKNGIEFMKDCHPDAELAPRDVVSRAIFRRMVDTHARYVGLDFSSVENPSSQFPGLARICEGFGIDIEHQLIPVRPAVHYFVGGIRSDLYGRTSVEGLFAIGECASTGFHGANRMGSNSLLEGLVHGRICGEFLADNLPNRTNWQFDEKPTPSRLIDVPLNLNDITYSLKSLMTSDVGVERDADGLHEASLLIHNWESYMSRLMPFSAHGIEVLNMIQVAQAVTWCAQFRLESRGAHFRRDFPETDARWQSHTRLQPFPESCQIFTSPTSWQNKEVIL